MLQLHTSSHKLDTVFVIGIFTMFAATSLLLSILGARQYQLTAGTMNQNYQVRTVASYLTEKIHQNDTASGVSVTSLDGTKALALQSDVNGTTYTTYIYYSDGWLRELYISDVSVYSLEAGQPIMEIEDFHIEQTDDGLLSLSFTDSDGHTYPIYVSLRSDRGKEAS